jgi:hypothetical protein
LLQQARTGRINLDFDSGVHHPLDKIAAVGRQSGVELVVGRIFKMAPEVCAADDCVLHLPILNALKEIGIRRLSAFECVPATLDSTPDQNQTKKKEKPGRNGFQG